MNIPKNPIGLKLILSSILTLLILTATSKSMAEDVTASSCSASDIQSAINSCASGGGGTVTIPACDFEKSCEKGSCWNASHDAGLPIELDAYGQQVHPARFGHDPFRDLALNSHNHQAWARIVG